MLGELSVGLNQTLQRRSSRPEDPGLFSRRTTAVFPIVVHHQARCTRAADAPSASTLKKRA